MYKQKYIKYKQKYLNLYNDIYGGDVCSLQQNFIFNIGDNLAKCLNSQSDDRYLSKYIRSIWHPDKYDEDKKKYITKIFQYIIQNKNNVIEKKN